MNTTFGQLEKGNQVYYLDLFDGSVKIYKVDRKLRDGLNLDISINLNGGLIKPFEVPDYAENATKIRLCRTDYDDYDNETTTYSGIYYSNAEDCIADVEAYFDHHRQVKNASLKALRTGKRQPKIAEYKFSDVKLVGEL